MTRVITNDEELRSLAQEVAEAAFLKMTGREAPPMLVGFDGIMFTAFSLGARLAMRELTGIAEPEGEGPHAS